MTNLARPRYKLLPHMSDAYVEVQASTLNTAFEDAAFAMFDVMTDPTAVSPQFADRFEITAHDQVSLLHDWLEELLLKFDLDGKVYSKFEVEKIETRKGDWHLVASAQGGLFQSGRHPAKVEIKAVTYHRMEVKATRKGYFVRYILDL
jgi:SHS2 domain-containing protein